jgi:DnaJ-class molecular chaperone
MSTTTTNVKTAIKYETVTCDRCGGSGRMPYAAYNGVCFKCHGIGGVYTRPGKKAKAACDAMFASLCNVAVKNLKPGMRIRHTDATGKSVSAVKRGAIVVGVHAEEGKTWEGQQAYRVEFRTLSYGGIGENDLWVLEPTPEQFAQVVAFARTIKKGVAIVETPVA